VRLDGGLERKLDTERQRDPGHRITAALDTTSLQCTLPSAAVAAALQGERRAVAGWWLLVVRLIGSIGNIIRILAAPYPGELSSNAIFYGNTCHGRKKSRRDGVCQYRDAGVRNRDPGVVDL
jgi:hypothetical protein